MCLPFRNNKIFSQRFSSSSSFPLFVNMINSVLSEINHKALRAYHHSCPTLCFSLSLCGTQAGITPFLCLNRRSKLKARIPKSFRIHLHLGTMLGGSAYGQVFGNIFAVCLMVSAIVANWGIIRSTEFRYLNPFHRCVKSKLHAGLRPHTSMPIKCIMFLRLIV